MNFAVRGDRRIHWTSVGAGVPVVLVPGLGAGSKLFGTLPRRFARAGYFCVTLDPVGIAPSSEHQGEYSFPEAAADVIAVLDAAGITQATLVGTSLGGKVATTCAAGHGPRVSRLVLLAASALVSPRARRVYRFFEILASRLSPEEIAETTAPFLYGRTFHAEHDELVADIVRVLRPDARVRALMVAQARGLLSYDGELPAAIRCPTLCLGGAEDTLTPIEEVEATARAITGARFVAIARAGHSLLLESEQAFTEILGFLRA